MTMIIVTDVYINELKELGRQNRSNEVVGHRDGPVRGFGRFNQQIPSSSAGKWNQISRHLGRSCCRFQRMGQLSSPGIIQTLHGTIY